MAQRVYKEPYLLSWGKFDQYYSNLLKEGAWRIGTITDGSCFFHAILTCISKSYRNLKDADEKMLKVAEIRENIGSKITLETWEKLQNGEPAHFEFLTQLRRYENVIQKILKNPDKYRESKSREWILSLFAESSYKILHKVLGREIFNMHDFTSSCNEEGVYLPMKNCKDIFVKKQLGHCVKRIQNKFSDLSYEKGVIEEAVLDYKKFLESCVDKAETDALNTLRVHFSDPGEWIGTEYLSFLGNQFNINIFLINGRTGLPYVNGDLSGIKEGRSNIFLLAVNESHFEALGFEINSQNSNKIKCKISWSHPFVRKVI